MKIKNGLSAEELEELVYKVICWMKKWALWDSPTIYSRGRAFSAFSEMADFLGMAERKQSGWRGWEDVWVWGYGLEEMGEDLQDILDRYALAIECGDSLDLLLEQGIYTAEFDSLPDAAQICLLRHMALFESCEDWWYEIYLEEGVRFQDTEFDSFDEYWELESVNQEEFKLELLKQCLRDPRESIGYNGEVAKLVLGELDEILKPYHLRYWVDPYCDLSLCIGYIGNAKNRKLLAIDSTRPMEKSEIDAILRKDEADIPSGKRDFDKVGMSLEEFRKRRKEAWEHMKN